MLVGTMLLYRAVLNEAETRVSLDLNSARELYQNRLNSITSPLAITSVEPHLYSELLAGGRYMNLEGELDVSTAYLEPTF